MSTIKGEWVDNKRTDDAAFIDKKGRIAGGKIGQGNWDGDNVRKLIKVLLEER